MVDDEWHGDARRRGWWLGALAGLAAVIMVAEISYLLVQAGGRHTVSLADASSPSPDVNGAAGQEAEPATPSSLFTPTFVPTPTPTPTSFGTPTPTPTPSPTPVENIVTVTISVRPARPVAGQAATVTVSVHSSAGGGAARRVSFGDGTTVAAQPSCVTSSQLPTSAPSDSVYSTDHVWTAPGAFVVTAQADASCGPYAGNGVGSTAVTVSAAPPSGTPTPSTMPSATPTPTPSPTPSPSPLGGLLGL